MTYKFRVLIDYEKDVFREIEIRSDQSFLDLNNAIISSFSFKGDQMASFYMSNEDWDKGEEIVLFEMGDEDEAKNMTDTLLKDMISSKNEKILYIYDFLRLWIFYIELIAVTTEDENKDYPFLVNSIGTAPKEEDKSLDFEMPVDHIGEDSELDPELKDLLGGDDDDDEPDYIDPNDIANFY